MMHTRLQPLIPLRQFSMTDLLVALCLTIGYLGFMLLLQHPTSINAGQGWDGYYYYQMAARENPEEVYPPFALRFGLPWLAGIFPTTDIFLNFKLINLACALVYGLCCYAMLAHNSANMHPAAPVIGWCLACTGNLAPIASVLWYPIQTDILCNLLALVFLMMVITGRIHFIAVALLFFAGTTIRENFPEFLMYAFLRLRLPYDRRHTITENLLTLEKTNHELLAILYAGLMASIAGLFAIAFYTGQNPFENKLPDIAYMANKYLHNPLSLLAVIINTISTILLLAIAGTASHAPAHYAGHLFGIHFSKLVMVLLALIALTGGSNSERLWYCGMPFFVLCALPAIDVLLTGKRYLVLAICLLWALFIQRSLVPIDPVGIKLDCGLLAILTGHSNWIGHWSDQCDRVSQLHLLELGAGVAFAIVALSLLKNIQDQHPHG